MTNLFKPVSTGNFYRPAAGQYVGELIRHTDAGLGKDFGDGKPPKPMVAWRWKLYTLDGSTPVMDGGEQAEVDKLAPAEPTLRNQTQTLFQAHLKRTVQPGEDTNAAAAECIGKRVMLVYNDLDGKGVKLTSVLPFNG